MEELLVEKNRNFDFSRLHFIGKGVAVGVLAGIIVAAFRKAIEELAQIAVYFYSLIKTNPWWLLVWLPIITLICLLEARLIHDEPNIKGSGIPQVEGQLSGFLEQKWWSVLWRKWFGGVLAIAPGLFLGREGPSIQLGAMVGQGFAEKTNHHGVGRRLLIAGGSAAGLSAAFNAPIAGTLFVIEEVYHNFSPLVWMTALSAALAANAVSMSIFGLTPVLHMQHQYALPIRYYPYLLLLGLLLGALGYLYQYLTLNVGKVYAKYRFWPAILDSIVPLLLVLPIGLYWPQTLGGGNGLIISFGQQVPGLGILLGMFVLRLLFSTLSYGSGLPGGIFLPILTLGAIIGALYGQLLVVLGLLPTYLVANFVVYAMAGYFACISKAPFTAILLITEMVGSLSHLMPLAVVAIIAYLLVDVCGGRPIYEAMLARLKSVKHAEVEMAERYEDRLEVPVFSGSYLQDKQVREISWPKYCLLVEIRRGENLLIPHGDTLIRSGDTLIFLTSHDKRGLLNDKIQQYNRENFAQG
ncbi:ClC family H(+)/Cl(-) exchange transporter [Ligilactobacillus equi]|uniref:Voltage-gated chloride channel family protein n=1 Tax=Ligilactobacillus equi DPC 6820 TaxID=1392007 RepID=V7I0E3_9LACO|nr:ClC family H(+)/Cl(-) exchange transporter [Ligilactobacillus equi]ETA74751.1 voltage-gated chloride channel family protein [Ligilactobacillus equi DPC 6820]